jgi:hypothetical protein
MVAANEWIQIINPPDFDIQTSYPYLIRKRSNRRIIKLTPCNGYLACRLGGFYKQHRIIAEQFLPNPNNLPQIDHINRNRDDNHLCNLRWVSPHDNNRNRTSTNGFVHNYYDTLPDDAIFVDEYGSHKFDTLLYVLGTGQFFVWNGLQYRGLPHLTNARTGSIFVWAYDNNNRQVNIYLAKYRRSINDVP